MQRFNIHYHHQAQSNLVINWMPYEEKSCFTETSPVCWYYWAIIFQKPERFTGE